MATVASMDWRHLLRDGRQLRRDGQTNTWTAQVGQAESTQAMPIPLSFHLLETITPHDPK